MRYIYKRYMQGASRVGIAKELNEEHITTANGAKWADSNVKCIYIEMIMQELIQFNDFKRTAA